MFTSMSLPACFVAVIFLLFIIRRIFIIVTIKSTSMFPTLKENDRVLVFCHYPIKWLNKGQVVIVWHTPSDLLVGKWQKNPDITPFIKRVIGLPGDIIVAEYNKLHGAFQKSYADQCVNKEDIFHNIPDGYIFVASDNPAGGLDSYSWGPISIKGVLGVVLWKLP